MSTVGESPVSRCHNKKKKHKPLYPIESKKSAKDPVTEEVFVPTYPGASTGEKAWDAANDTSLRDEPEAPSSSWNPWFKVAGGPAKLTFTASPQIILANNVGAKFSAMMQAVRSEISCLAVVKRDNMVFTVEELLIFDQVCSSGHTELDQEAMAKYIEELVKAGRADILPHIKGWFHSHPKMGCFWSETDKKNRERIITDWLVSVVMSDDFKMLASIDLVKPFPITFEEVPIYISSPISKEDWDAAQALAHKHVSQVVPTYKVVQGFSGWNSVITPGASSTTPHFSPAAAEGGKPGPGRLSQFHSSWDEWPDDSPPADSPQARESIEELAAHGVHIIKQQDSLDGADDKDICAGCSLADTPFCLNECNLWKAENEGKPTKPPCKTTVFCPHLYVGHCNETCRDHPGNPNMPKAKTSKEFCDYEDCIDFGDPGKCNCSCNFHPEYRMRGI